MFHNDVDTISATKQHYTPASSAAAVGRSSPTSFQTLATRLMCYEWTRSSFSAKCVWKCTLVTEHLRNASNKPRIYIYTTCMRITRNIRRVASLIGITNSANGLQLQISYLKMNDEGNNICTQVRLHNQVRSSVWRLPLYGLVYQSDYSPSVMTSLVP